MNLRVLIVLVVLLVVLALSALMYGATRGPDRPGAGRADWAGTLERLLVHKRPLKTGDVRTLGACLDAGTVPLTVPFTVRLPAGGSCLLQLNSARDPVRRIELQGDSAFVAVLEQSQRVTVQHTGPAFGADLYRGGGTLSLSCLTACTVRVVKP